MAKDKVVRKSIAERLAALESKGPPEEAEEPAAEVEEAAEAEPVPDAEPVLEAIPVEEVTPPPKTRTISLPDMTNDLIGRITELSLQEEFDNLMLTRVYRMREELVDSICDFLRSRKKKSRRAKLVEDLYAAIEDYVVFFVKEPDKRSARRRKVEALKLQVRRRLLGDMDEEGAVEQLLDDIRQWQWKTTLDEDGRIAFATGSGVAVPGRSNIIHEVGPKVVEQAIKAQRPYADKARPRDVMGRPGGLVVVSDAKRLLVVGDLHGRYDNLEWILRDKRNLRSIIEAQAHLVFTGDAVHPRSSRMNSDEAYEDSFCVMLLIMTLKAENPFNVHYLIGNHDNAHVGGYAVGRGTVQQDAAFEKFIKKKFGASVLARYREFVLNSPAAMLAHAPNGAILLVHATPSQRVLNDQGLVNIFVQGRQSPALRELLWGRNFNPNVISDSAERVGARFVIGGHTVPSKRNAKKHGFEAIGSPAFGQAGEVQIIMSAQCDVFGYMDIDLTRRLPNTVGELKGPDGQHACRIIRPRGARLDDEGK